MKSSTIRSFVFSTALFYGISAYAAGYSWTPKPAEDMDNVLTNDCHTTATWAEMETGYGVNTLSVVADKTKVPSADSLTLTLPTDYQTTLRTTLAARDGKKLVFDSPNEFRQRDLTDAEKAASGGYNGNEMVVEICGCNVFSEAVSTYISSKNRGGWSLDGVRLSLDGSEADVSRVDLDRGVMNMYDPNGTALSSAYIWFLNGGTAARTCYFNVHAGSTIKMPTCFVYDSYGKSVFTIDGGTDHFIHNYEIRTPNNPDVLREHTLRVTGPETKVTFDYMNLDKVGDNHRYRVEFVDGAKIDVTSWGGKSHSPALVFQLDNVDVTLYHAKNSVIYATNSTFRTTSSTPLFTSGDFHAKNVTFSDYKNVQFVEDINLDWEGCDLRAANSISFFHSGSGTPTASFRNCVISNDYNSIYFGQSGKAKSQVLIDDTYLFSSKRDGNYTSLIFGSGAGEEDTVEIRGNSYVGASHKLMVGSHGAAKVAVCGGEVSANYLTMQEDSITAPVENVFVQAGGVSTFAEECILCCLASSAASHCEIILSNGVFRAKTIKGGSNCSAADPAKDGVAIVRLRGGRLEGLASGQDLVKQVNHLYVGAGSSEISGDVDFNLPLSLEGEGDGPSEVVFTGSGTKTLSGTATTVSRIVVRGGTVRFASGARAASTLVVEKGGTVVFDEDPSAIGFTGLELKGGVVTLAPGQILAINGDVMVEDAVLDAVCAFPSTNVLITATGTMNAASRTAWAKVCPMGYGPTTAKSYVFDVVEEAGVLKLRELVEPIAVTIGLEEGVSNATENISLPYRALAEVDVAGGAVLTMSGTVDGGVLSKLGEGLLKLDDLGLWNLGAVFYLRGGTFEYVGNGSESVFDRPFVIAAEESNRTSVSIKNDSPLTITDFDNVSGVLIKRGAGALTIAPPSGSEVNVAPFDGSKEGGGMDSVSPTDFGDIASETWQPPSDHATMGFNVLEGEVVFRGDAETRIDASRSVILGGMATSSDARAGLTVDGCRCSLAGDEGQCLEMGYTVKSTDQDLKRPYLNITNGAEVTTRSFICGRLISGFSISAETVVDDSTWTIASGFRPSYDGGCDARYYIRNNAAVYANDVLTYGPFKMYLDGGSTFARNAALEGMTLELHYGNSVISVSNDSAVALAKLDDQRSSPGGTALTLDFAGGTWHTPANRQVLQTARHASWVINTLTEAGLTFPVEEGRTLSAAHAIQGAGGIVKTGAGTLAFETAGEWATANVKTPLDDPQTVKFSGPIDVREGAVVIQATAGREGGTYRTSAGASIDFSGAAIGAAKLAGTGTFANATLAAGTLVVGLKDDGTTDGVPTLDRMTFEDGLTVDFGRIEPLERESEVVVARFAAGSTPSIAGWTAKRVGKGWKADLSLDGNEVKAACHPVGLVLIVR